MAYRIVPINRPVPIKRPPQKFSEMKIEKVIQFTSLSANIHEKKLLLMSLYFVLCFISLLALAFTHIVVCTPNCCSLMLPHDASPSQKSQDGHYIM